MLISCIHTTFRLLFSLYFSFSLCKATSFTYMYIVYSNVPDKVTHDCTVYLNNVITCTNDWFMNEDIHFPCFKVSVCTSLVTILISWFHYVGFPIGLMTPTTVHNMKLNDGFNGYVYSSSFYPLGVVETGRTDSITRGCDHYTVRWQEGSRPWTPCSKWLPGPHPLLCFPALLISLFCFSSACNCFHLWRYNVYLGTKTQYCWHWTWFEQHNV